MIVTAQSTSISKNNTNAREREICEVFFLNTLLFVNASSNEDDHDHPSARTNEITVTAFKYCAAGDVRSENFGKNKKKKVEKPCVE